MNRRSVLIAVPTFETIAPETFKSIYGLERPEGVDVMFDFVKGYDCARARNMIAREALDYGFDLVLMVDSDVILPRNALTCLTQGGADVVLGVYPRKNTSTGQTEVFKLGSRDFLDGNNLNVSELAGMPARADVKGGGMGCAMISVDVFRRTAYPWFRYVEYDDGAVLSEDNYFCAKAAEAGARIQVDTRVRCSHLMRYFKSE